ENKIDFQFTQTPEDFVVDEIPSFEFKKSGNFLILHIKKVEYTTWDMIATFAEFLRIPAQKIGYAGLKDKHATTTQYISVDARHESALKKFRNKDIRILSSVRHNQPIRMGDLKGNRFTINLREITNIEAGQIEKIARKTARDGLPNYFGYQRFGSGGDSIKQADEMINGDLHIADNKVKNFLISIYQSEFFNRWLRERVLLSVEENDGKFQILDGDLFVKKGVPSGLLCGRGVKRATSDAGEIEKEYDDEFLQEKGYRRAALIFPEAVKCNYNKKQTLLNISFELPKGSYATVFLENIAGKNYTAKDVKAK
ncbi:MAG: tRNA pseudouridine(13) synthase TruD, partial [Campylobacterota bacterium]|nr:tRNA pseudouridine(13) synthase TruD [Campylobacterota bacterium]